MHYFNTLCVRAFALVLLFFLFTSSFSFELHPGSQYYETPFSMSGVYAIENEYGCENFYDMSAEEAALFPHAEIPTDISEEQYEIIELLHHSVFEKVYYISYRNSHALYKNYFKYSVFEKNYERPFFPTKRVYNPETDQWVDRILDGKDVLRGRGVYLPPLFEGAEGGTVGLTVELCPIPRSYHAIYPVRAKYEFDNFAENGITVNGSYSYIIGQKTISEPWPGGYIQTVFEDTTGQSQDLQTTIAG